MHARRTLDPVSSDSDGSVDGTVGTIDTAVVDVDGTLVDTNYHHTLAWARAFARHDLFPPLWRIHRAIGMGGDRLVAAVSGDDADECVGDAVRDAWVEEFDPFLHEVRVLAGAKDFLIFLRALDLRVVLATSGKPEHVDHYLDILDGRELADAWVTAEDAERSKPAPDMYDDIPALQRDWRRLTAE